MMRFEDAFELGYFARYEITHEMLAAADAGKLLCYAIRHLEDEVRYRIFGELEPSAEQREAYYRSLHELPPWKDPPPIPWEDWSAKPLPQPVFTNVRASERETTVITMVFGGWLRDVG